MGLLAPLAASPLAAGLTSLHAARGGRDPLLRLFEGTTGAYLVPGDFDRYMASKGPELVGSYAPGYINFDSNAEPLEGSSDPSYQTTGWFPVTAHALIELVPAGVASRFRIQTKDAGGVITYSTTLSQPDGVWTKRHVRVPAGATQMRLYFKTASDTATVVSARELTALDTATLFSDAAGTTPLTSLESAMGLVLDRSKGLVRGAEHLRDPEFAQGATHWSFSGTDATHIVTFADGALRFQSDTTTPVLQVSEQSGAPILEDGKKYEVITVVRSWISGSIKSDAFAEANPIIASGPGVFKSILTGRGVIFNFTRSTANVDITIDSISIRELPGHHATQATAAARMVLSSRANLLTQTERLDDATWLGEATVQVNVGLAPNGTNTANRLTPQVAGNVPDHAATGANRRFFEVATANGQFTHSIYVKTDAVASDVRLYVIDRQTDAVKASTPIVTTTAEWQRITVTGTTSGASVGLRFLIAASQACLVWGAQAELGPTATRYQRVGATATDYDTVGFPVYAKADGVDDAAVITFPAALGSDCTVMLANLDGTVTTLAGQTIGTSYTITQSFVAAVVVGRALSILEQNRVRRAFARLMQRQVPDVVASLPGAPGLTATAGNAQAFVTLAAPASDGGSPILDYTITRQPGDVVRVVNAPGTYTFDGLTNGVQASFSATARTAIGTGPASATVSVTPADVVSADTFDAFRMAVSETSGGVPPIVGEIAFRAKTGAAALTGTAFASSTGGVGTEAAKAFDGNANTYAQTALGDSAPHFGLTPAAPEQLAEVLVTFPVLEAGNTDGAPLALQFEGLKNGAWSNLKAFTVTGWTPGEAKLFVLQSIANTQVNALNNSALDSTASWDTSASGVTISGGACAFNSTTADLTLWQTAANMARVPVSGETIRARFRVTAYTEGNINPRIALSSGAFIYFYSGDATGNGPLAGGEVVVGQSYTTPAIVVPAGVTVNDAAMRIARRNGAANLSIDDFEVLIG